MRDVTFMLSQDLTNLKVEELTPLTPEVISRQATINIGTAAATCFARERQMYSLGLPVPCSRDHNFIRDIILLTIIDGNISGRTVRFALSVVPFRTALPEKLPITVTQVMLLAAYDELWIMDVNFLSIRALPLCLQERLGMWPTASPH